MRPHVFIVGCARSGTTLLQRLVDAHPMLAVTPSMHWVRDLFREHGLKKPDDPVPPALVPALVEHPRFSRLRLDPDSVLGMARPGATHAGLLSGLFELYGGAAGKPLVGNKTAPFVRRIPELHRLWREARFVHIIRDGRDVALSMLEWESAPGATGRYSSWGEDPVSTAALWWRRKVLLGREGGDEVGWDLYHEVRYEDLVADTAGECERLCGFLDVPYDESMLRFHEGKTRAGPGLSAKKAWLPVTTGLRDWRGQMSEEDKERFEAAVGGTLEELGYERVFPGPPAEASEDATTVRRVLAEQGSIKATRERHEQPW